jgi:hypothetical protein
MAVAWLALTARRGGDQARALLAAAIALAYLPWLPTVIARACTPPRRGPAGRARCSCWRSRRPVQVVAAPLLVLALVTAVRRRPQLDQGVRSLLT